MEALSGECSAVSSVRAMASFHHHHHHLLLLPRHLPRHLQRPETARPTGIYRILSLEESSVVLSLRQRLNLQWCREREEASRAEYVAVSSADWFQSRLHFRLPRRRRRKADRAAAKARNS
jgi:hypothetical protein